VTAAKLIWRVIGRFQFDLRSNICTTVGSRGCTTASL